MLFEDTPDDYRIKKVAQLLLRSFSWRKLTPFSN